MGRPLTALNKVKTMEANTIIPFLVYLIAFAMLADILVDAVKDLKNTRK